MSQLEVPNHKGELPVFMLLEAFDDIDERVEMLEAMCAYVPAARRVRGPGNTLAVQVQGRPLVSWKSSKISKMCRFRFSPFNK